MKEERRTCCDTTIGQFHRENCPVAIAHKEETINHPPHYGGDNPHEVIKFIHAHQLNFNRGNTVKYIVRAGRKNPETAIEDLKKAMFYLNYEIELLEGKRDV